MSKVDLSKFWIVSVISNPIRFKSRETLFKRFQAYIERHGANLCIVELAYGDRPFTIEHSNNPNEMILHLRTQDEIWHKENLVNVGISRLPSDWEYVAWIDADIEFKDDNWLTETWHQLQHHHVVQMFSHAIDFGPQNEIIQIHNGFVWSYWNNQMNPPESHGQGGYYAKDNAFWHPGYAWAASREAINHLGGLMQFPILGAGDHHMALALIGEAHRSLPGCIHNVYKDKVLRWQDRALRYLKKDIGYLKTTIFHHWHGKKKDRKYIERWDILTKNKFNPDTDIKLDSQGVLQLVVEDERQIKIRDMIRLYFRNRSEDSIDLE